MEIVVKRRVGESGLKGGVESLVESGVESRGESGGKVDRTAEWRVVWEME